LSYGKEKPYEIGLLVTAKRERPGRKSGLHEYDANLSQRKLCADSSVRFAHNNVGSRLINPEAWDVSSNISKCCKVDGFCRRKMGS